MLIANFYFHYAMLTINAFGLQNALERSAVDIGHFFARCHSSAVSCASILTTDMGPSGWLKYAPDSHFVLGSYAVLSLLKVGFSRLFVVGEEILTNHYIAYPTRVPSVLEPRAEDGCDRGGGGKYFRPGRRRPTAHPSIVQLLPSRARQRTLRRCAGCSRSAATATAAARRKYGATRRPTCRPVVCSPTIAVPRTRELLIQWGDGPRCGHLDVPAHDGAEP